MAAALPGKLGSLNPSFGPRLFGTGSEAPCMYLLTPVSRISMGDSECCWSTQPFVSWGLGVCRAVYIPADECIDRGVNNARQIYCCSKNKPFVKDRITQGCQQLEATPLWGMIWLELANQARQDGSSTGVWLGVRSETLPLGLPGKVLGSQQGVHRIFVCIKLTDPGKYQTR